MKNFLSPLTNFIREEDGATAVEYGILVAAIAAVIVIVTLIVGAQVENAFNRVCKALGGISGAKACS
ncbi:MAG TPA: Flp family type IVb pilin [Gallionella sp.]|nr:Flp family type IVb pilin [Gallionella sp.]